MSPACYARLGVNEWRRYAVSSSQEPIKIKVWFNLKKPWQKYYYSTNTTKKSIIKTLFLKEYLAGKLFTRISLAEKCKYTTVFLEKI